MQVRCHAPGCAAPRAPASFWRLSTAQARTSAPSGDAIPQIQALIAITTAPFCMFDNPALLRAGFCATVSHPAGLPMPGREMLLTSGFWNQ